MWRCIGRGFMRKLLSLKMHLNHYMQNHYMHFSLEYKITAFHPSWQFPECCAAVSRQLSHQASPVLPCQGCQAKWKVSTQSCWGSCQLCPLNAVIHKRQQLPAQGRMSFVLCTHTQFLHTRCAFTPAPQKWAQEFTALSKDKNKAAAEQKLPQAPEREAAVDKNEDLEFVIERLRHWGNVWKPLGFKVT